MFYLGFITGGFIGFLLMGIVASNRVKDSEKECRNAESRALQHFRKLLNIENTIKKDERLHEYTIYTVRKIKKILEN